MQKKATAAGGITVFVSRMGADPIAVDLAKGATVNEALAAANVSGGGRTEYFVSGVRANGDDILEHKDVLSLVTPKQAGS